MTKVRDVQKPQWVSMAAGLGSRYGVLKQTAPADGQKHLLIDFAIYGTLQVPMNPRGFQKGTPLVQRAIAQRRSLGIYPERLWSN